MARRRPAAIRLLVFILLGVLITDPAMAIPSYTFGISPSMTVVANQSVDIPAVIINTSGTPIDFMCAVDRCGGWHGVGAVLPTEGLNALNISFENILNQFVGRLLTPSESFKFTFANMTFDPSNPIGNPLGTTLHPQFFFNLQGGTAAISTTISVGDHLSFAPFTFACSTGCSVPVPSMLWPTVAGMVGVFLFAERRRLTGRTS
jgi:hypothetical protein